MEVRFVEVRGQGVASQQVPHTHSVPRNEALRSDICACNLAWVWNAGSSPDINWARRLGTRAALAPKEHALTPLLRGEKAITPKLGGGTRPLFLPVQGLLLCLLADSRLRALRLDLITSKGRAGRALRYTFVSFWRKASRQPCLFVRLLVLRQKLTNVLRQKK